MGKKALWRKDLMLNVHLDSERKVKVEAKMNLISILDSWFDMNVKNSLLAEEQVLQ